MNERERDKEKSRLQHTGVQCDNSFNEFSPRPPVPGEERSHSKSDWGNLQTEWTKHKSSSPASTNKRSSLSSHYLYNSNDVCSSTMGFEPDCGNRPPSKQRVPGAYSPPAYLRWARALHFLLEDSDGVQLFRRYLQAEGKPHADALDFWFACEGLRKQPDKISQLIKVIYKRFFLKSALPISDELRRDVGRRVKEMQIGDHSQEMVFDLAQAEVERLINNTTYPNFLKSDMYLQYVQAMQNPATSEFGSGSGSSSSSSSISAREMALLGQGSGLLPTLHEDHELVTGCSAVPIHSSSTGSINAGHHTPGVESMRLTKDMLIATQKRRLDVRPKPEAYAGMFAASQVYRLNGPYHPHPHASYSSYNPVSRQDSELQSLSSHSDARTESDNMSLTDSSLDGISLHHRSSRKQTRSTRAAKELAALNRDPYIHQTLIPRTQRIDNKQCQPMKPDQFAAILIDKLETVKREQEAQEKLDRKLMEGDFSVPEHINDSQSRTLADAIREKFHLDDDNDQDILDQHVSRVWSDLTPSRSPGLISPRAHSPTRRYPACTSHVRSRRKEKDVFSTFSSDSGNVHDFPEGMDHKNMGMIKSKSMPEYAEKNDYIREDRFIRQSVSRRSSSKKTLTDLTDSGVSVVSDTPPVPHMPTASTGKESRVLNWLLDSDRSSRSAMHTHSELSGKHRSHRPSSTTSPNASRHRKTYSQSRSSSLERSSATGSLGAERPERRREPAQPFIADPNMPPLPPPHTATQLEEARRRLMEDDIRGRQSRQRGNGKSYAIIDMSSNQSTLKKSARGPRPQAPPGAPAQPSSDEYTTAMISFCDEQFPYRTKIPGRHITLKQFKEYLPKKGNYRYFFKTECEELDNQVIQEEISCDSDLIPLWEGKVMAQVKPTE